MIVKKIETFLKGSKLFANLFLQSHKTALTRVVDVLELDKINIGDDIKISNGIITVLQKNNKNKYILQRSCPECGNPLQTVYNGKKIKEYICTNLYGCPKQREMLLTNWCKQLKINSLLPLTQEFLDYFNLDNFILDRTKKMAIEKVIPLLYILNEQDINKWLNNPKLVNKIYNEIENSAKNLKLADIFQIFPHNLPKETINIIIKKYENIETFFALIKYNMDKLHVILKGQPIYEIIGFIDTNLQTIDLLGHLGVNLINK